MVQENITETSVKEFANVQISDFWTQSIVPLLNFKELDHVRSHTHSFSKVGDRMSRFLILVSYIIHCTTRDVSLKMISFNRRITT